MKRGARSISVSLAAILIFTGSCAAAFDQGAWVHKAEADEAQGHYEAAAQQLEAALAEPHLSAPMLWIIGKDLAYLGECDTASRAFARVIPYSTEAYTLVGFCRFRTHHFQQAIEEFHQAIRLVPNNEEAHVGLARALAEAGDDQAAVDSLKAWLAAHPEDKSALYWLGHFYDELANQTFRRMAAAYPNNYLVYETEGIQDRERQEYPQALAAYERALKLAPKGTPGLHFYIGDVYWRTLRFADAKSELEQELRLNPDHAKANYELGDIYAEEGHPRQAIPYLTKAVALDPGLTEAHRSLGRAYLEEKDYSAALREFLQVAQANPSDHTIHALLSSTYRLLGRLRDAQREALLSEKLAQLAKKQ